MINEHMNGTSQDSELELELLLQRSFQTQESKD